MKNTRFSILIILLLSFFLHYPSKASHLIGSDLTWTCVGNDSFLVKLAIYRDCNGADMSNVEINFNCKSTGAFITSKSVQRPTPTDITPTCDESCTRCDDLSCSFPYGIQRYIYNSGIVLLNNAGACCEVLMSYYSCCRSNSITTGAANKPFYTDAWLNRCISPCDNSPTCTNPPVAIICRDQDFIFCHGVMDFDVDSSGGLTDSLVYKMTQPLGGIGNQIQYSTPYSYDKPIYFLGFPNINLPFPKGFSLDKNVGAIKFHPMKIEQTSMAIKIEEYRNGILIGELRRDIYIIVIECPANNLPELSEPYFQEVIAGDSIGFSITSHDQNIDDSIIISWNEGLPGASWYTDNHIVRHPTATISWTPDSAISEDTIFSFVITAKDDACPVSGTTTRAYQILVKSKNSGLPNEAQNNQIKMYPNPTNDEFIIELKNSEKIQNINIIDPFGKIVKYSTCEGVRNIVPIRLEHLTKGIYLVRIQLDNKIYIRKVILSK